MQTENWVVQCQFASLLEKHGKVSKAMEILEHILDLSKEYKLRSHEEADVMFQLGNYYVKLNRGKAIKLYKHAIILDRCHVKALVNLSAQLLILGKNDDAYSYCSHALAIDPNFKEAHYNLNTIMRRQGKHREVVEMYWDILSQDGVIDIREDFKSRSCLVTKPKLIPNSIQQHDDALLASRGECLSPRHIIQREISIICVKWGSKYNASYVNKLFRGIKRAVNKGETSGHRFPVKFICLTDDTNGIEPNITCIRLESGWNGWWNKIQIFSRVLLPHLEEHCIYIDLDTVIVGDISQILLYEPDGGFAVLKTDLMVSENRINGYNSSIIAWNSKDSRFAFGLLYDYLKRNFDKFYKYIYKFDHFLEMTIPKASFLTDQFPEEILEYNSINNVDQTSYVPNTAKIICFPLQPKPHNAKASWIKMYWK